MHTVRNSLVQQQQNNKSTLHKMRYSIEYTIGWCISNSSRQQQSENEQYVCKLSDNSYDDVAVWWPSGLNDYKNFQFVLAMLIHWTCQANAMMVITVIVVVAVVSHATYEKHFAAKTLAGNAWLLDDYCYYCRAIARSHLLHLFLHFFLLLSNASIHCCCW